MAGRDTTIADVKSKCPQFQNNQCPYTSLKGHLRSPVLKDGCIVKPGQCKTLGEVADILASKVPEDQKGQKALANDLQDSVRLSYIKAKNEGMKNQDEVKRCPILHGGCPFAYTKDGKPVLSPPSAIGSVYVTKAEIEKKCPVFKNGTACPYKLKELNGLGKGCPAFRDGHCPFNKFELDVGKVKELLGEMRDEHKSEKAKANGLKALQIIQDASKSEAMKHGNCPFFKYGCHFATDLNNKPIEN